MATKWCFFNSSGAAGLPFIPDEEAERVISERSAEISKKQGEDEEHNMLLRQVGGLANLRYLITLEMQSEDTSATRDPLKEACLARGVWMNS